MYANLRQCTYPPKDRSSAAPDGPAAGPTVVQTAGIRCTVVSEVEAFRSEKLAELDAALQERMAAVESRESATLEQKQRLHKDRWALDQELAELESQREILREDADRAVAAGQAAFSRERDRLVADLERVQAERQVLEDALAERRRADQRLAGRSAEDVSQELEHLRAEVTRLDDELARRPSEDLREKLQRAVEQRDDALAQLQLARRDADEAEARLKAIHVSRIDLEAVRDERDALAQRLSTYRALLEEQKAEWAQLVEGHEARPVFERMTAMDGDASLQRAPNLEKPSSLPKLIEEIGLRIAAGGLYYTSRDLRLFLGGLAMSRILLLEGISGTGKTSLPREFAHAVLGGSRIIEVQAGWRDRQDLIGHYNTFERRYEETPFVQALYEAQCPEYDERPFIVILDEMNLSHPEQYFADLLSGLESPPTVLTLMNQTVAGAPTQLLESRKLIVPDNVWFVGTANQDETTFGFADKTYDRAHIQELPANPEPFAVPGGLEHKKPISVRALTKLFTDAAATRKTEAEAGKLWLRKLLPECQTRFGVGWGPRLEGHLLDFAPVVIEAGGDIGEAVDHLVASQILRKVRGRHDIRSEDVDALSDWIESNWADLAARTGPDATLRLLSEEQRRLAGMF